MGYHRFFDDGKSMIGQKYHKYVIIYMEINYAV
jgi:hypothetical protein